jgi:dihydrofolate reductase
VKDFACVVAADQNNGIGRHNDLPWPKLPADLKHFRDVTSTAPEGRRNAVLMGRKTWDSIPPKYRPMPQRLNVVITRGKLDVPDGVLVAASLDDALAQAEGADSMERLFVVGGGEIFRQSFAHPRCGEVYLTRVDATFDCDTFIPDVRDRFTLADVMATHREAEIDFRIERWVRQRPGT